VLSRSRQLVGHVFCQTAGPSSADAFPRASEQSARYDRHDATYLRPPLTSRSFLLRPCPSMSRSSGRSIETGLAVYRRQGSGLEALRAGLPGSPVKQPITSGYVPGDPRSGGAREQPLRRRKSLSRTPAGCLSDWAARPHCPRSAAARRVSAASVLEAKCLTLRLVARSPCPCRDIRKSGISVIAPRERIIRLRLEFLTPVRSAI